MKINDIINNLKKTDKNTKNKYLVILGLVGILLIFISSVFPKTSNNSANSIDNSDLSTYSLELKNELENTVSKIEGAGKAEVFLTFERGYEYIYAKTDKQTADKKESTKSNEHIADEKSSGEEEYIIIKTENGEEPLVVTEIEPKVKGVVIVCKGGENEIVANRIKGAVSVCLGISESKICVVPKSK